MKRSKHSLFVFPSKKKPLIWRRSCSIGQSCCGMTSKRSIRSLYPFHKPIKSLASHPVSHRIKPKKFLTVYSLFVGGRLLTFSTFRMGAYSRWALIRGWALIRINTVLVETFRFYWRRRWRRGRHFSILRSACTWTRVILAGKRVNRRHSTTSFSENVRSGRSKLSDVRSFFHFEINSRA